jgi:hypothetical protein
LAYGRAAVMRVLLYFIFISLGCKGIIKGGDMKGGVKSEE